MLWFPVGYTVGYLLLLVWSPLRCADPAPTRCPTSPRPASSRAVRRLRRCSSSASAGSTCCPQFQGAGLALSTGHRAPRWSAVSSWPWSWWQRAAGGMRSITLVQAMQYWLKLTAIAIPAFVLLALWWRAGRAGLAWRRGADWARAAAGGRDQPVYATYSLLLALCFGTMGLPHVLVRFYTNPDGTRGPPDHPRRGRPARALLPVSTGLRRPRSGLPPALPTGRADSVVRRPARSGAARHASARCCARSLAGGAFAAFLSTASGLTISVAGVIDQDLLPAVGAGRRRPARCARFRLAAVVAVVVPFAVACSAVDVRLADTVGLAFAVAASTFCPAAGARSLVARAADRAGAARRASAAACAAHGGGAHVTGPDRPAAAGPARALAQPAAWTVPLGRLPGRRLVSRAADRRSVPPSAPPAAMVRLHAPRTDARRTPPPRADCPLATGRRPRGTVGAPTGSSPERTARRSTRRASLAPVRAGATPRRPQTTAPPRSCATRRSQ